MLPKLRVRYDPPENQASISQGYFIHHGGDVYEQKSEEELL